MAIVELDRESRGRPPRKRDGGLIAVLLGSASLFAAAVWIGQPVAAPSSQHSRQVLTTRSLFATADPRDPNAGVVLMPRGAVPAPVVLAFPRPVPDVQLGAIPDRLANEAPPSYLSNVVWVRGRAGIATVPSTDGSAVISWTEGGVAYWLVSSRHTIHELVTIADELRMPTDLDMRRPNLDWRRR